MGVITFLILLAIGGLFVGALARLALPGPDPMSIWATIGIGVLGSLIGGLIVTAFTGRNGGSIVLSIAVATGLVYLVRRSRGQSLWSTRRHPGRPRP